MSRRPGFDVMDVDTSIVNDPKFKRILRSRPEHAAPAFMAYVALLGESWKAAERTTIVDAWPALVPFDDAVVESMKAAELLDKTGRIPAIAWRKRFTEANERRLKARERWARYNEKRAKSSTNDDVVTTSLPRGRNAVTATSVPSVPTVPSVPYNEEIPPPPAERGRRPNGTAPRQQGANPRATGESARQNGHAPRQERDARKRGEVPVDELEAMRAERARQDAALTPDEVKAQVEAYLAEHPLAPRPPLPERT